MIVIILSNCPALGRSWCLITSRISRGKELWCVFGRGVRDLKKIDSRFLPHTTYWVASSPTNPDHNTLPRKHKPPIPCACEGVDIVQNPSFVITCAIMLALLPHPQKICNLSVRAPLVVRITVLLSNGGATLGGLLFFFFIEF